MPRRMGKTHQLILKANKTKSTLVMHSSAIKNIKKITERYRIPVPHTITYQQFLKGDYDKESVKDFIVDDIEFLLREITNKEINTISLSTNITSAH